MTDICGSKPLAVRLTRKHRQAGHGQPTSYGCWSQQSSKEIMYSDTQVVILSGSSPHLSHWPVLCVNHFVNLWELHCGCNIATEYHHSQWSITYKWWIIHCYVRFPEDYPIVHEMTPKWLWMLLFFHGSSKRTSVEKWLIIFHLVNVHCKIYFRLNIMNHIEPSFTINIHHEPPCLDATVNSGDCFTSWESAIRGSHPQISWLCSRRWSFDPMTFPMAFKGTFCR